MALTSRIVAGGDPLTSASFPMSAYRGEQHEATTPPTTGHRGGFTELEDSRQEQPPFLRRGDG